MGNIRSIIDLADELKIQFLDMPHYALIECTDKVSIVVKDAGLLLNKGLRDIIKGLIPYAYPSTIHIEAPFCTAQNNERHVLNEYDLIEWRLHKEDIPKVPLAVASGLQRARNYVASHLPVMFLGYGKS